MECGNARGMDVRAPVGTKQCEVECQVMPRPPEGALRCKKSEVKSCFEFIWLINWLTTLNSMHYIIYKRSQQFCWFIWIHLINLFFALTKLWMGLVVSRLLLPLLKWKTSDIPKALHVAYKRAKRALLQVMYPKDRTSFRAAGGQGFVQLKCESDARLQLNTLSEFVDLLWTRSSSHRARARLQAGDGSSSSRREVSVAARWSFSRTCRRSEERKARILRVSVTKKKAASLTGTVRQLAASLLRWNLQRSRFGLVNVRCLEISGGLTKRRHQ